MFSTDRNAYRNVFFDAWHKHQEKIAVTPLEAQLIDIMLLHPEYHGMLSSPKEYALHDFAEEANPFLHMSLHLAIVEQVSTDRPAGIAKIYAHARATFPDAHTAAHHMMTCLEGILREAKGKMPDEYNYLTCLQKTLR